MNARNYRADVRLTPIDFPPIMGLGESSVSYLSEPKMINEKLALMIMQSYVLVDTFKNEQHIIFTIQSLYEIPPNEIKTREDVYDVYNDATSWMNEAYQYARIELPALHNITFPNQSIENYKNEIDRVFGLLDSRN
ncbi:hypothetical protein [Pinibacter aurantiacus]|uniref:Uncharacterized protein n=1 Tax=Pinibacter aurantiacus TaxID=2851599 RepID=A0A9E2W7H7_9BACT|nr:hypothetical protein [Pinibacter aurantiacus]MBV4356297.1 hypothetical protein [Pinibacter aurantiacus]